MAALKARSGLGMSLPKRFYDHIRFAAFCRDYLPDDFGEAAELIYLAHRAFSAGERECNIPDCSAERSRAKFSRKAEELGFGVQWSGLWPTLLRDGREVRLPAC